jgi:hypothetical protein
LGRTPTSSQRAASLKAADPKSSVTVNRPWLTGTTSPDSVGPTAVPPARAENRRNWNW